MMGSEKDYQEWLNSGKDRTMKLELIRAFYDVDGGLYNEWQDEETITYCEFKYNGYILAEKHTNKDGKRYTAKEFRCEDDDTVKELYHVLQRFAKQDKVIVILQEALQEVIDFIPNDTDYPEKPTRDECIDEIKYFARAALDAAGKAGE